jgi:hypothetical protein
MPIPFVYGGIIVIPDPLIPMSGLSQPFWGALGGPPSIRINPDQWVTLPEGAQQFLLDHERGHCVLGHTSRPALSLPMAAQREWDADTYAATAMLKRGQRALLDQQIRWLRWLAVMAPPPGAQYAPWQVQADHLAAVEAGFPAMLSRPAGRGALRTELQGTEGASRWRSAA